MPSEVYKAHFVTLSAFSRAEFYFLINYYLMKSKKEQGSEVLDPSKCEINKIRYHCQEMLMFN